MKKKLDKVFSWWIRNRDSREGFNQCFTCRKWFHLKDLQCGHYVSRSYNNLRFNEINCNPQCVACNVFKKGNLDTYAIRLMDKHGKDVLNRLDVLKWIPKQFTPSELLELIQKYE